jgi:hypothetical protein
LTADEKTGVTEEGAKYERYTHLRIQSCERRWTELLFSMSDMDTARYEALKGIDIFEFYTLFDNWKKRIEEKNKAIEEQLAKAKSKNKTR